MKFIMINTIFLCVSIIMRFIKQTTITGFGYKTSLSMKNINTWNEGNKYSSNLVIMASILSIILGIILYYLKYKHLVIIFYLEIVLVVIVLILTEIHLRKLFDKYGNKK